jgi:nicotinamide N-methyltransferase
MAALIPSQAATRAAAPPKQTGAAAAGDDNDDDEDDEDDEEDEEEAMDALDFGGMFGDPQNSHGSPDEPFTYEWPDERDDFVQGGASDDRGPPMAALKCKPVAPIRLRLPAPEEWDLMAHFVWESSIKMADLVAQGVIDCRGKRVLEVGAGAGLPSIVSAYAGAALVVATDYPEETVIDALRDNVRGNTTGPVAPCSGGGDGKGGEETATLCDTHILGHGWGTDASPLLSLLPPEREEEEEEEEDSIRGNSSSSSSHGFDVVLAADCLWLHDQHVNLLETLVRVLPQGTGSARAVFTYQHHNEHAPAFFELAESKYGLIAEHIGQYGWAGRELDEFDEEDEEVMGPIFLSTLRR